MAARRRVRLSPAQRLTRGVAALALVLVIGTAGYVGFGFNFFDALFQTVTTVTTVGFGELHPFDRGEQIFTIFLIFLGTGTAAYTIGVLIESLVEGQISDLLGRRRMEQTIRTYQDHLIVCGWGRVGQAIAQYLVATGQRLVVIDQAPERIASVPHPYIEGDATDDATLQAAGIDKARAIVTALNTDADNLYVTLTARSLRPDLFIVARASSDSAVPKLIQAGADRVVNPHNIGGARMAAFASQPNVAEFLDFVGPSESLEFRLNEVHVPTGSPLSEQTLGSARLHERTGAIVLAVREDGHFTANPALESHLHPGQVLIVFGNDEQVASLRAAIS